MGLMDRDYMHERHRSEGRRAIGDASSNGVTWRAVGWTITLCAVVYLVVKYGVLALPAQPFPPSGSVFWYTQINEGQTAPLTIAAPQTGDSFHVVRVDQAGGGPTVALIPVRRGHTVKVDVPLGQYEMIFASGERWLGPEELFGITGEKRKAAKVFHFYRNGNEITGHNIDLTKRVGGNLETRPSTFLDR